MSLIRTDLNKAGWLYNHPDVQQGFPKTWVGKYKEMYGALGVALHLDDEFINDEDELTHLNVNAVPMMAIDDSMISHLLVQTPIEDEQSGIWLLFADNHFIGQVDYHNITAYTELVQASIWEKIAHQSGFTQVRADKINSSAPYDPKIYLTPEQAKWANSHEGIYDPYA